LALGISYIFAVLPDNMAPHIESLSDKTHHVFAFVVLGLFLRLSYRLEYWYALVWLVGYGAFIELSQYFLPTRSADYQDIVADLIGAFIGLKLYKYLRKVI
jgi:VanZ family protein